MNDRDRILRGWAALREHSAGTPAHLLEAADLKVETGFGTAKLSLDLATRPQLILPAAAGARRPKEAEVPLLQTIVQPLSDGSGFRPHLVVTLLPGGPERAFADLIEAVLSRIEAGEPGTAAFVSAVRDFQALFQAPDTGEVDEARIRGLVAELLLLQRLTELDPRAVELWFGPDRDRHDFRGGQCAVEVKSSRRQSGRLTISALEQLATPEGGELYLRRYVLENSVGGDVSVATLHDDIVALGAAEGEVRQRLAAMGCADPSSRAWNHASFNVEGCETYRVADDFPRLVPGSFPGGQAPAGVSGISYEIDLSTAAHLRLREAEAEALEEAILSCLD